MSDNYNFIPSESFGTQRSFCGRFFQKHTILKGKSLNDFSDYFRPTFKVGKNVWRACILAICMLTSVSSWGQFVRVGEAISTSATCYQLTPQATNKVGAIWYQSKINLNFNFQISGTLNFGTRDFDGADGIGFVLQPVSNGIGELGGGLGFQGINPSLGVEFDVYQNSDFGDPVDDHIALVKHGNLNHYAPDNLQGPFILPNLENGANHPFSITWNATTKTMQVVLDGTLRINYSADIVANLFSDNPFVFWGFTAATGAFYNFQSVCFTNYSFIQDPSLTWTNSGSNGLWSNSGNWTGNTVPSSNDAVIFNAATPSDVDIDIDPTIKSLEVNTDYNGVIKLGSKTLAIKNGMKVSKFGSFNAGTGKVKLIGGQKISVKSPLHKVEIDAPDLETITLEEDLTVRDRLDIKSRIGLKKAALIATVLQRKIKAQGAVSIQAPMSPSTDVVISMSGESDQDFNSVGGAIIEVDKPTPASQVKLMVSSAVKKMDILKGLLNLNKNKLTSAEQVKILLGGKVTGKGKVAAPSVKAQKGSKIAPGNSPGLMTIEGDLIMESEAVLEYEITATEHDVLEVQGTVNIDQAILEIQATGTPTFSVIMVIDNDGTDLVSGTFAGLPEGSLVTIAGNSYRISYVGGTGNDVTLSENVAPDITCPNPVSINTSHGACNAIETFNSATATDNFSTILAPIAGFRLLGTIGHHAYYLSDASMVYSAAQADAYAHGGHLVTLANAAENTLVTTGYWTWIGLNDLASTNNYAWITNEPLTYTNWESGEPNNVGYEHNGMLFPNGKWNNSNDVIAIQYILELENVLTITQTAGLASGSTFPLGSNNIVFTATDAAGNTSACSFTVTVTDNEVPVINCPTALSINTDLGVCGAVATFSTPTATDNCSATVAFTSGLASGSTFPVGTTTNVFTATDASGNTAKCSFTVTVTDIQGPIIYCPTALSINSDLGVCGAVATFSTPTATDNCSSVTVTFTSGLPSGSTFPVGTTKNVFTATDASGNITWCSFNITVTDNQKPGITCPANQSINLNASCNGTLPNYTGLLTVSDNCTSAASLIVTQSPAANTPLSNKGSAIVTFTVKDQSNNSSSCTITVEKKDVTAPTISCPSSVTKTNDAGNCSAVVTFPQTTATDNCTSVSYTNFYGGEPNQAGVENHLQLYLFNNGSGSLGKWNDLNMNGLNASIVEVNSITSAAQIGYSLLGSYGGHTYYYKIATQTWSAARSSAQSIGGDLASINTLEENQFIVTSAPNGSSAWVGGYQDATDPDYAEPGNVFQNYGGWKWVDGTRFGKGRVTITKTSGISSGSAFPVGTTTNIFKATDEAGNSSTCSFTITVNDTQKPILVGVPGNTIVQCDAVPSQANVTATDNCPGVSAVTFIEVRADGNCPNSYTLTRTWQATDAHNNTQIATQIITVIDNTVPTFTRPADIILYKDANCNVNDTPTGSAGDVTNEADNCSIGLNATYSDAVVQNCEGTYTITRTWHLVDKCGNAAADQVQTITVLDNTAPTFSRPADITLYKDASCGANTTIANTGDVTNEADNCSTGIEATYTDVTNAGTCEGTYTITRTWHLVDKCGNAAADQVQIITVLDNTAPTFTRPVDITLYKDASCNVNDSPTGLASDVTNESDNCSTGLNATYSDAVVQNCQGTYTITRTWNLMDKCGNAAPPQYQTITVKDNTAPTFTLCPTAKVRSTNAGVCNYTAASNEFDATAKDNCSTPVMTYELSGVTAGTGSTTLAGVVFEKGATTVKWTATDACGNKTTCSFTVTVNDTEKPTFTICPSSASRNTNPGLCTYTVVDIEFNAKAKDNCDIIVPTYVLSGATTGSGTSLAGIKLYVGTTTVTWTAVDAVGNTKTCSYTVLVNDDQNPTSFIIYAAKEVKFGEYNYINGDIGVTAADGKASFKKYDVLNPYTVTAKNIDFDLPSSVSNRVYTPATGGPNPTFYMYNGNTSGLSNYSVSTNTVLAGNYKDLTIKKGVVATIQGNNFGKISIEEGAQVTFSSTVINMEDLDIKGGKKSVNTTNVYFTNPTSVKVKDKVKIDADCYINVNGPKVTFYLGDNKGDEEKFTVKGDNSMVTANVMIPNGKLKVNGGESRMSIMTGWYIVEKLESTGKYITWNTYDCSMPIPSSITNSESVTADIRVHAEYVRNVISFVTNQGTKTGFWTLEKRNEESDVFETVEVRQNVRTKEALQYLTFYDIVPSEGVNFYRIKLTNHNGDVTYSAIEKVNLQKTIDFTIYPNPADNEAWIDLKSFEGRQVTLVLSDMLGKAVQQYNIQKATAAPYRLDVTELPTGLYLVKVQAQGKRVLMRKLQVTK